MSRKMIFRIIPTDWKNKWRKAWLRELINKRRIASESRRTISAQELNEIIDNKMIELDTVFEKDAVEALIEEVKNGKEY